MFINRVTFATLIVVVMGAVSTLADVSINNPVDGTQWVLGRPATVTWIEGENGFDPDAEVTVELMRSDDPNNLDFVAVLGTAKETDGRLSFTVPRDLEEDDNYVVRIGNRYSSYFTITKSASPSATDTNDRPAASASSPTSTPTQSNNDDGDDGDDDDDEESSDTPSSKKTVLFPPKISATTSNNQPFMMANSLLALVCVAVIAIWGF
jgi:hypothetical protein